MTDTPADGPAAAPAPTEDTTSSVGGSGTVGPPTPWITEPGIYDLTSEEYHADPVVGGSLSSTLARKLLDCRAKAKAYIDGTLDDSSDALSRGKAAHHMVLGVGSELYIPQHHGNSNKGKDERRDAEERGATVVGAEAFREITAMADALRAHSTAAELLHPETGWPEQTLVWRDKRTGVMRRAMFDFLPHWVRSNGVFTVPDYKTGKSAKPSEISKSIANYGYHIQGEFYLDGVKALGLAGPGGLAAFVLLFQEIKHPYVVTPTQYTSQEREIGRILVDEAVDLYIECVNTGIWPDYSDGEIVQVTVPQWYVRQFEDAQEAAMDRALTAGALRPGVRMTTTPHRPAQEATP